MTVAAALAVPDLGALRESLELVLGRAVRISDAGWAPPAGVIPVAVGSFVDAGGTLRGCVWLDLPLAAAAGAAMSLLDPERVPECVALGVVVRDFHSNVTEVLTVAGRLLDRSAADDGTAGTPPKDGRGLPGMVMRGLELLEKGLDPDTLALLADPRAGGYYDVDIDGYGGGILSVTLA